MSTRTDSLLAELQNRHGVTDTAFLTRIRPMIATILDPSIPEEARTPLLEALAETFDRHVRLGRDFTAIKQALDELLFGPRRRRDDDS